MPLQTTLQNQNTSWKAYEQWVEVDADKVAYTAASPENALVFIGPNRVPNDLTKIRPIGLLQNFTVGQSISWQAQQMIGSGRTFFLAGKAPGNGQISRLFTSTSTLLGAIYESVYTDSTFTLEEGSLESKPYDEDKKIMFSLDSELFKIPFGMACMFRNTAKKFIGGFYVEHVVIPTISMGFSVGQAAIFETVDLAFDRIVPFDTLDSYAASNFESKFSKTLSSSSTDA